MKETIVFISRHSLTQKVKVVNDNERLFIQNIKTPLSIKGEENAIKMSNYKELQSIDIVYSSNYSRAISTAKYVAEKNNLDINIDYRFGERKHGVENDYNELPSNFGERQLEDENYKFKNGESRKEVTERMRDALFEVVNKNKTKKIFITSHATAMLDLFISFGKIEKQENRFKIVINNKVLLDSNNFNWNEHSPELFKLVFDENNNLKDIEYILW